MLPAVAMLWGCVGVVLACGYAAQMAVIAGRSTMGSPGVYAGGAVWVTDGQLGAAWGHEESFPTAYGSPRPVGFHVHAEFGHQPRFELRRAVIGFEVRRVAVTRRRVSIVAVPIWFALLPCGAPLVLWFRRRQRRTNRAGFAVVTAQ